MTNAIANENKKDNAKEKLNYKAMLESFITEHNLDKKEVCQKYKLTGKSKAEAFRTAYIALVEEVGVTDAS